MPGAEVVQLPPPNLGDDATGKGDDVTAASANLRSLAIVPSSADARSLSTSSAAKGKGEAKPKAPQVVVPTQTKSIGIIHPPPDIRSIVDKTATFVARNGPDFEKKILATNRGNAKFNFLNPSDPYHAYYRCVRLFVGVLAPMLYYCTRCLSEAKQSPISTSLHLRHA